MAAVQKTFKAKVTPQTGPDVERGTFTALVSVFGNTDSYGDVVEAGAFTKTLAEWIVKGRQIPIVWSHKFSDLDMILGGYTAAEETGEGLLLTGKLDISHPPAARVHDLMERGLITEFSWSGEVREYALLEDDEDSWWAAMSIRDVDLWEAGPCFKGANPDTELLSIKTDGQLHGLLAARTFAAKAGRVLSQKNLDALITARDAITDVIEAAKTEEPEPASTPDGEDEAPTADKTAPTDVQRSAAATPNVRALLELSSQ